MTEEFYRIKRLAPYVFAEVNALKAKARAEGRDIIDFGMGNPDLPTPDHIVEKLVETVQNPKTHRYSNSRGIPGLRRAVSGYYERRFNVSIDPETEAIATIGSKEGLANLAQAITTPGDVILTPNPSYPIHAFGFIIAGAALRNIPVFDDLNGAGRQAFFDSLDRAIKHSIPKPLAVVINFPSNPTAQLVDLDFYEEMVAFCRSREVYLLSDIAYAEVYYREATPPPSVLQVKGAKDIAVEFYSLSKTYSMPGWRVGFACGNPKLIAALTRVKSYVDYGAFTPIQVAAAAALNGPQDCIDDMRTIYEERRDVLCDGLSAIGWDINKPLATMFAWAKIPEKYEHMGSVGFSKFLLEKADVAVSPGIGFGEYGDGHVRLALVENKQRIRQAVRSMKGLF